MNNKSYTLPILLLYLLTSLFFLFFFSLNSYQTKKAALIRENLDVLREFAFDLAEENVSNNFKFFEDNKSEIKINLYKDRKTIKENFASPNFAHLPFIFDGKYLYIKAILTKNSRVYFLQQAPPCKTKNCRISPLPPPNHIKKMPKGNYEIILKSANLQKAIFTLILKICLSSLAILSIILLIAYIIVKLSFKNMQNQLNLLNNFIIDTTHEINTPLCIILMSIEMFPNNPKKYLNNIKTASKTLSNIYDDLVRLNLLEEKNDLKNIDIKALLEERISFFTTFLEQKKITLSTSLEALTLKSDDNKLTKIFDNLLSNAIKYSKENQQITLVLKDKSFKIINYNAYIKKNDLKKIFEKFKRFDKQNGGFGIGLSIVKKYCDDLNIQISCESDEEKTSFELKF